MSLYDDSNAFALCDVSFGWESNCEEQEWSNKEGVSDYSRVGKKYLANKKNEQLVAKLYEFFQSINGLPIKISYYATRSHIFRNKDKKHNNARSRIYQEILNRAGWQRLTEPATSREFFIPNWNGNANPSVVVSHKVLHINGLY